MFSAFVINQGGKNLKIIPFLALIYGTVLNIIHFESAVSSGRANGRRQLLFEIGNPHNIPVINF